MNTEFMTVKNNIIVETQWGKKRVINLINQDGGKEAIWISDTSSMLHIKDKQKVEVIRDAKGKLTILERSNPSPQESPRNVNGSGLKSVSETLETTVKTFPPLDEEYNTVVDDLLDELPILSPNDKKKVAALIQQNSKLLKYCCDCVAQDFDDLDDRSVRSLATTLFINAAMTINKHL